MRAKLKRVMIQGLGWLFIVLGIAGLFLPFLQGILFLLIGLYILSHESVWAHRLLEKVKNKFPDHHRKFEETREKYKNKFKAITKRRF